MTERGELLGGIVASRMIERLPPNMCAFMMVDGIVGRSDGMSDILAVLGLECGLRTVKTR